MIENQDIICFGFAEWDNPYRTNQHHLMGRFSQKNRVLFIESLGLRRPALQKKDIKRIFLRLVKFLKGTRKISENLYILSPFVLPFHKYAVIRFINRCLLLIQLRNVLSNLKFKKPVLWSYVPNAVDFLGKLGEKISVYHCVDELSANPLIPPVVKKLEKKFIASVNLVFATSKPLFDERKNLNKNTYYLPNVADFEHFHKAVLEETVISAELENIPHPRIGFIGAISSYKLDFGLIQHIAGRRPEWSFVFIGSKGEGEKEVNSSKLETKENIHFLGGKAYGVLPNYLKGFDVCILPNLLNEYTKNMFPMKFFEYLASGKPVVSTYLDSLLDFGDFCYLSRNAEEFESNIRKALNEDSAKLKESRINLAKQYTWESRIEEMSRIIYKRL